MTDTNVKLKAQSAKQNNPSIKASSMAELMKKTQSSVVTLHKSEAMSGTITKLTPSEVLVDIQGKTEAVVLEKDKKILRNILTLFHVGDKVTVSVLNPESETGNPVVSLRRHIEEILWSKLKKQQEANELLEVVVEEATRGGFIVTTANGLTGFLPSSQTSHAKDQGMLGQKINVFLLDLDRQDHKIIFSQKPNLTEKDFEKLASGIKVGDKIEGVVTTITPFGIFVSLPALETDRTIDGLIHISEISWERTADIGSLFTVGQKVEAVVIRLDKTAKRADLSIKRLESDPFEEIAKKYEVDQQVEGEVTKILASGIALNLGDGVEGFIRKEKIPPTVSYEVGSTVTATVSEIDNKRHRIVLTPVLKEKPIGYR